MVALIEQAIEAIPICEKHGVEKYQQTDGSKRRGWRWACRECIHERQKRWYRGHAEEKNRKGSIARHKHITTGEFVVTRSRADHWYTFYRLRIEDVLDLYEKQERRCMFGGEPLAWEDVCIEHQHAGPGCRSNNQGKEIGCPKETVRGVSCNRHNTLEGQYIKDPNGFMSVVNWHIQNNGAECPCAEG